MRDYDGELTFNPKLPNEIKRIQFNLSLGENLLGVDIKPKETIYSLKQGSELNFTHRKKKIKLKKGKSVTIT
ncbi:MAG: hypothetical protein O7F74_01825 [Bacteroidetes bacterium]|nr:hypothetical protein [Bacteroidota bacterium]